MAKNNFLIFTLVGYQCYNFLNYAGAYKTMKIYYEDDANLEHYKNKKIAVIGYGSQGHAHALNLKESGIDVIVAQRAGGRNYDLCKKDGFHPYEIEEAVQQADVVHVLLPDEIQKEVYEAKIAPHLSSGKALVFSHGFNIHFGFITPKNDIDVYMVAPKGPGHVVRREYLAESGVPCLIAIHNDASGNSKNLALAHAKGIGGTRVGVLETTFKEETETDLFGEQSVLCGGLVHLILAGFETLVEAGYSKEMAYFECLHEMKLIVDLMYEGGIHNMRYSISETAEFGDYETGPKIINAQTKETMKQVLTNIQNGSFAKKFIEEARAGKPTMKAIREKMKNHDVEVVGEKLRQMMVSLFKKKTVR